MPHIRVDTYSISKIDQLPITRQGEPVTGCAYIPLHVLEGAVVDSITIEPVNPDHPTRIGARIYTDKWEVYTVQTPEEIIALISDAKVRN